VGTKGPKSPRHVVTDHFFTKAQSCKITHQQKVHFEECHRKEKLKLLSLQIWWRESKTSKRLFKNFLERNDYWI